MRTCSLPHSIKFIALTLLTCICACSGTEGGNPNANASVTVSVGPAGGELKVGEATLSIPPGTLDTAVEITLSRLGDAPPSKFAPYSAMYRVSPPSLVFTTQKPALLTIPYTESTNSVAGFWSMDEGNSYQQVMGNRTQTLYTLPILKAGQGFIGVVQTTAQQVPALADICMKDVSGAAVSARYNNDEVIVALENARAMQFGSGGTFCQYGGKFSNPTPKLTGGGELRSRKPIFEFCDERVLSESEQSALVKTLNLADVVPMQRASTGAPLFADNEFLLRPDVDSIVLLPEYYAMALVRATKVSKTARLLNAEGQTVGLVRIPDYAYTSMLWLSAQCCMRAPMAGRASDALATCGCVDNVPECSSPKFD